MRTVMIWDECGQDDVRFVVFDEDYSELDRVYINNAMQEEEDKDRLNDLIYDDEGRYKVAFLKDFPVEAVKNGAIVIVAGFLP